MTRMRLTSAIVTLFLLSAAVFAFNSTPSAPAAVDDSDQQVTAGAAGEKQLVFAFFASGIAEFALLLRRVWGTVAQSTVTLYAYTALFAYIARGPPLRQMQHALL